MTEQGLAKVETHLADGTDLPTALAALVSTADRQISFYSLE
jgi:hypothetical protein